MRLLAILAATTALATPTGYVAAQQREDGGFGDAQITAWATIGLAASGAEQGTLARAAAYFFPGLGMCPPWCSRPPGGLPRYRCQVPGAGGSLLTWRPN